MTEKSDIKNKPNVKTKELETQSPRNSPVNFTNVYKKENSRSESPIQTIESKPESYDLKSLQPFPPRSMIYIYASRGFGKSSLAKAIINTLPECNLLLFSKEKNNIYTTFASKKNVIDANYVINYDNKEFSDFIEKVYNGENTNLRHTFVVFDEVITTQAQYKKFLADSEVSSIIKSNNPISYIFIECSEYDKKINDDIKTQPNLLHLNFDKIFIGGKALNQMNFSNLFKTVNKTQKKILIRSGNFIQINSREENDSIIYIGNVEMKKEYYDNLSLGEIKNPAFRTPHTLRGKKKKENSKNDQNANFVKSDTPQFESLMDVFTPVVLGKIYTALNLFLDDYILSKNKK